MKRMLLPLIAAMAVAAACGGGDKKPAASAPTDQPAATATAEPTAQPTPTKKTAPAKDEKAVGGVFNSLFSGALSGGEAPTGSAGLGQADPKLSTYLPADDEFPAGFAPMGEFSFRVPDGISTNGKMDMAAKMAFSGGIASKDLSKMGILMAMVLKPDDLQSLGGAFDDIKDLDPQDLKDTFRQSAGGAGGFDITDVQVLDSRGIGDGSAGIQMTIDVGSLAGAFSGVGAVDGSPGVITMRMYIFSRGDYAGAVLRMAFTNSLPDDGKELALAHIVDRNLKSAN